MEGQSQEVAQSRNYVPIRETPGTPHSTGTSTFWGDINTSKGQTLTDKQNNIMDACLDLINYSIGYKYLFQHWKKIVAIIIVKEVGNSN
eukprot:2256282-Ditylum_brightwellii.AAC.1